MSASNFGNLVLKRIYRGLVVSLFLLLGVFILFAVLMPKCGSNSDAVELARSLTQTRLSSLYADFDRLYSSPSPGIGEIYGDRIPDVFSDLKARKVNPAGANIMLEGCFDHYVYLSFCGLEQSFCNEHKIILRYGDMPQVSEVLWQN
jgi:hypothetical protein